MSMDNGSRTTIHIGCSVAFKERVQAYAKRRGQSVSDAVVDMLTESLKFEDFTVDTDRTAAADDWQAMVKLTNDGHQVP
jgi:macrodomain Ter protein organizer (MatP/YcbG family)